MVGIEAASHEHQNQPTSFKNPKTRQKELFCRRKSSFWLVLEYLEAKKTQEALKIRKPVKRNFSVREKSSFWLVFSLKSLEKNIRTLLLCCFSFASSCSICLPPFMNGMQTTLCELLKARAWEGFEWFELKQPATNPKTSQQALKIRKPGKRNFSVGEKVPFGWFWNI